MWYRIPDAREIGVRRSSLGRLSTFESLWEARRDPIRVLQLQGRCASPPPPLAGPAWGGLRTTDRICNQAVNPCWQKWEFATLDAIIFQLMTYGRL